MCLKNCIRIHRNEPITCYKVLIQNGKWYQRKKFTAPFRTEYNYIIGNTYNEKNGGYYNEFYGRIDLGYFHSFANLGDAIDFIETFPKCYVEKPSKLVIVECEIPKGSVCYEGFFSYCMMEKEKLSYASKSITIKRIIK